MDERQETAPSVTPGSCRREHRTASGDGREQWIAAAPDGTPVVVVDATGPGAEDRVAAEADLLRAAQDAGNDALPRLLGTGHAGYVHEYLHPLHPVRGRRRAAAASPTPEERQAQARAREMLDRALGVVHAAGFTLGCSGTESLGAREDRSIAVRDLSLLQQDTSLPARLRDQRWVDAVLGDADRTLRRRLTDGEPPMIATGQFALPRTVPPQQTSAAAPSSQRAAPAGAASRPAARFTPLHGLLGPSPQSTAATGATGVAPPAALPSAWVDEPGGEECPVRDEVSGASWQPRRAPRAPQRRSPMRRTRRTLPGAGRGRRTVVTAAAGILLLLGGGALTITLTGTAGENETAGEGASAAPPRVAAGAQEDAVPSADGASAPDPTRLLDDLAEQRRAFVLGTTDAQVAAPGTPAAVRDDSLRRDYAEVEVTGWHTTVHEAEVVAEDPAARTLTVQADIEESGRTITRAGAAPQEHPGSPRHRVEFELTHDGDQWRIADTRPV
ncbi:MAG: hypothetical protein Q4G40_01120 [Brachybacterium sp.]|nr:hypothetical protein [Brachybacterium sp.]